MTAKLLTVIAVVNIAAASFSAFAAEPSVTDAAHAIIRMEACRDAWNYHTGAQEALPYAENIMVEPTPRPTTKNGVSGQEFSYTISSMPNGLNICGAYFVPYASEDGSSISQNKDDRSRVADAVISSIQDSIEGFYTAAASIYFIIPDKDGPGRAPITFQGDLGEATRHFQSTYVSMVSKAASLSPSSVTSVSLEIIPPDPPSSMPTSLLEKVFGYRNNSYLNLRQLVDTDLALWDKEVVALPFSKNYP